MSGNVKVGEQTLLNGAILDARQAAGCKLEIGEYSYIQGKIVMEKTNVVVHIGSRTFISSGTLLDAADEITVGDDVLIASGVLIMDHDSHAQEFVKRKNDVLDWCHGRKDWSNVPRSRVVIGNKSWIGAKSIILKGVTVGEGAVIGAGSVLTKNVDPWTVVAGNPARVIRELTASGKDSA